MGQRVIELAVSNSLDQGIDHSTANWKEDAVTLLGLRQRFASHVSRTTEAQGKRRST
jgi:hypothetical protein